MSRRPIITAEDVIRAIERVNRIRPPTPSLDVWVKILEEEVPLQPPTQGNEKAP